MRKTSVKEDAAREMGLIKDENTVALRPMSRPATVFDARRYHEELGHEVRIGFDGSVVYRKDPGCQEAGDSWFDGGSLSDYRVEGDQVVRT